MTPKASAATSGRVTPRLEWTGNPEADALIAADPTALMIGFCLDQQIPIEKAFVGPLLMRERLGTLDARALAAISPETFAAAFRQVPAIHRFPGSMAQRVQALCVAIATDYDGDAERIWTEAEDAKDLLARFAALPGFGKAKAAIMVAVVAKRLGLNPTGWKKVIPEHPTLADVSTVAEREAYQAQKRARKAAMRAADARDS